MRLIIDQLAVINETHLRSIQELSKHHEICYWINMKIVPVEQSEFPRTLFHDFHDAVKGVAPKGINTDLFKPWSKSEIEAFSEWESTFLIMSEKWYPGWSTPQRYDLYYQLLQYWRGVVDLMQPDCIVFNSVPHQLYNLVLYAIAKDRKIKTIVFDGTFRLDRLIYYNEYRFGNDLLAEAQRDGYPGSPVRLSDLPEYIQEQYNDISKSVRPPAHHFEYFSKEHARVKEITRRVPSLISFIKDGSIFERAVLRFFKLFKKGPKDEYTMHVKAADFTLPYIYVPLHYQPECTTSPQGGIYVEQILLIKTLSAALPNNWQIYVKEHPAQWLAHADDFTAQRYRSFYSEIAHIPHVRLVPVETNSFDLSDHSKTTATVSGTAAWESILRGKSALVFGYPWYRHAPGIYRVSSVDECTQALQEIASGKSFHKEDLFRFLSLLDQVTFWGHIDYAAGRPKTFDTEQEWKDMYLAIEGALAR